MAKRRTRTKLLKRILLLLLLLGIGALIAISAMPKPLSVDLGEASRGEMRVTVDEDGRTRVIDRHTVSSPLTGSLARIELRAGDRVREGEIVARLVPLPAPLLDRRARAELEARLASARAAQRQARAGTERARAAYAHAQRQGGREAALAERGATSAQSLDRAQLELRTRAQDVASAEFGVRIAAHQVQMAQAALGHTGATQEDEQLELGAPVGGQVLRVLHESEGVVAAGAPLLELGEPSALEIVVDVLTSDAVHIAPGARVQIERWGGEHALEAHVRRVEPSAYSRISALGVEEQRVDVIVDLDEPHERWEALGDGYRVEARIIVWSEADVLRVPASAVFRRGEGWAVFLARDGQASLREISVGRRNGLEVQILGGLEPGDPVILHPSDRITEGSEIVRR
ncbi:MAG: efflux RND transporter periplasmic adaptor subunit [Myxococcales bacterium]|nr:efflux RND transporter periplasmic adaptor subunit [Myxococcales bacterium]